MAYHEVPLGPVTTDCLEQVGTRWAGCSPNQIVTSGLGLLGVLDSVRRSGREVVAARERRGRPESINMVIDPRAYENEYADENRHPARTILELRLDAQVEADLQRLRERLGPGGVRCTGSIDDVVRDAIWAAHWMCDAFDHNYQASRVRPRKVLEWWIDRQPGNPDLRTRERFERVAIGQLFQAPKPVRPSRSVTLDVALRSVANELKAKGPMSPGELQRHSDYLTQIAARAGGYLDPHVVAAIKQCAADLIGPATIWPIPRLRIAERLDELARVCR